jgi:NADH-quinone oxidoreductase subunit J
MIQDFLFFLFAAGAVLGSILVITRRNPVASVLFLVVVFFCVSGLFLLLDAHFIAALNVILYAGAIMVLFLFVIMLLNLGHAAWTDMRGPLGRLLAGSAAVAFLAVATRYLFAAGPRVADEPTVSAMRAAIVEQGAVGVVARPLFEQYMVPFQLTGLLLLVAIVGTIVLARRRAP